MTARPDVVALTLAHAVATWRDSDPARAGLDNPDLMTPEQSAEVLRVSVDEVDRLARELAAVRTYLLARLDRITGATDPAPDRSTAATPVDDARTAAATPTPDAAGDPVEVPAVEPLPTDVDELAREIAAPLIARAQVHGHLIDRIAATMRLDDALRHCGKLVELATAAGVDELARQQGKNVTAAALLTKHVRPVSESNVRRLRGLVGTARLGAGSQQP